MEEIFQKKKLFSKITPVMNKKSLKSMLIYIIPILIFTKCTLESDYNNFNEYVLNILDITKKEMKQNKSEDKKGTNLEGKNKNKLKGRNENELEERNKNEEFYQILDKFHKKIDNFTDIKMPENDDDLNMILLFFFIDNIPFFNKELLDYIFREKYIFGLDKQNLNLLRIFFFKYRKRIYRINSKRK